MPRKKATPQPDWPPPARWPREIVIDGSRLMVDLIQIDGRDFVSVMARDGSTTEYPVSSLEAVRPNIHKAVFG